MDLPNKHIQTVKDNKKAKEIINETFVKNKEKGAFLESVFALVKKPDKKIERKPSHKQQMSYSKIEIDEKLISKQYTRSETPNSVYKTTKPVAKYNVDEFYFKKQRTTAVIKAKAPNIIKSTFIGASKSINSIDVESNVSTQKQTHKLYEKFDSKRTGMSRFLSK